MNYVKVSVILAEIINFILLLIEVGVQQWTLGLKAHGELITIGFSHGSYDSTLFENRMYDLWYSW